MKQAIQVFDKNPVQVGLKSSFTTLFGAVIGILSLLILLLLSITKFRSVINREQIYLNYYKTSQVWPVKVQDFNISFLVYTDFDGFDQKDLESSYKKLGETQSRINQLKKMGFNFTALMIKQSDEDPKQYELVQCQYSKLSLCLPQYVIKNGQVAGYQNIKKDTEEQTIKIVIQADQQKLREYYSQKLNKTLPQDQQFQVSMYILRNVLEVNPKQQQPRSLINFSSSKFSTSAKLDQVNYVQVYYFFSCYNLTIDRGIFPAFIQNKQQFLQYGDHQPSFDQNYTTSQSSGYSVTDFYITLKRLPVTYFYDVSYQKADSVLAQILAINQALVAFIIIVFGGYNIWKSQKVLLRKIGEDVNEETYGKYLLNKIRGLKKKQYAEINKKQEEKFSEIKKCADLIEIYKVTQKLKELEITVKIMNKVIRQDEKIAKRIEDQIEAHYLQTKIQQQKQRQKQQQNSKQKCDVISEDEVIRESLLSGSRSSNKK